MCPHVAVFSVVLLDSRRHEQQSLEKAQLSTHKPVTGSGVQGSQGEEV